MEKKILEGISVLPSPPRTQSDFIAPVVNLDDGLCLSDSVFEAPTLLLGPVGSGKSFLLQRIMEPILASAEKEYENVIVFCAKKELLKYRRPGDPVIAVDATQPNACWNIYEELRASENPELTARDIMKDLTGDKRSQVQPFFENSCNDVMFNVCYQMFLESKKRGVRYTNWHLYDFFNNVSLNPDSDFSWQKVANIYPGLKSMVNQYFYSDSQEAQSIMSEVRTLMHDCFWGSFCSAQGSFSAIDTLKSGGKRIFLYFDYANASEASIKIFKTILNLLLKHSVDEKNGKRTWFFLDEFSLLPKNCICDAMSLGRGAGFRLFACLQSAQLMTRHYSEDEAKSLLSLFPNIICLKVQDALSRSLLADRYGESLFSYYYMSPMQKIEPYTVHRKVVEDADFSTLFRKGDALMSIPNLSSAPFYYHGYRKDKDRR